MRPHLEAEGGGNGLGVLEDISEVRNIESLLEVGLELGFPIGITEIDRRVLALDSGEDAAPAGAGGT